MGAATRALIIGVDGATFDVIHPLAERGELPNLSRFLRRFFGDVAILFCTLSVVMVLVAVILYIIVRILTG